jgi:hypothetical protein
MRTDTAATLPSAPRRRSGFADVDRGIRSDAYRHPCGADPIRGPDSLRQRRFRAWRRSGSPVNWLAVATLRRERKPAWDG